MSIEASKVEDIAGKAWRLYKACKDSSEDFGRLSGELMSLHAVLTEMKELLIENQPLDGSQARRLGELCDGCGEALDELDGLVRRYDSLGTQAQRTWDRMRFGLKDVADVKVRLVSSVTLMAAFNAAIINSSTAHLQKKVNKFLTEVQAGLREGSVVTAENVTSSIDAPDVWMQLRRELEDVGIGAPVAELNQELIKRLVRRAMENGDLRELIVDMDMDDDMPCHATRRGSLSSASRHSEMGGFEHQSPVVNNALSLSAANTAFEEELRRQRAEWNPDDPNFLDRSMTEMTEKPPSPKVRKRTGPVGLVKKLFKNEKAIIEAASDGDIDKVAECISLGMDVNVREKWGWSALSMCAYGGHRAIAKLLLDHGADLDNVDVDGDTPTSLAAQRGHTELVILFDEERAARDLRVREMDTEVPRPVVG